MKLEILSRKAEGQSPKTPLLFVHGAYVGAWCWEEHFLDWFAARGHPAHALSLRGHGASEGHRQLNDFGLADYAEDVAQALAELEAAPVLVGHSMGALVVQKFLEKGTAPAAVLACPVPAYGLLPSSFTMAWTRPALFAGLNSVANGGRASPEVLREALFCGQIGPERLERCYQRMQRESRRALFEMAGWSLPGAMLGWGLPNVFGGARVPTLVLGAERDSLIAHREAEASARLLGAEYRLLAGIGHAIMLDEPWESAAAAILGWLQEKGL
ncbi:MAG TPA: alpha/beta hydrolase [Burkholderiales bacterium]|jgi:non-heme chloroperoxidase|nr:alpha/beta hydrolase [Burkholderiales bacterium]